MTPRPLHHPVTGERLRVLAGAPKAQAKRGTPEANFQKALVEALTFALPEPYSFHASPVGVNLGKFKGGKMKAQGVRANWADLTIVNLDTGACRWMELKSKDGALSEGQERMAARLGDKWATVKTLDQAQAALLHWRVPLKMPLAFANRYQAPMWGRMGEAERAAAWGETPPRTPTP